MLFEDSISMNSSTSIEDDISNSFFPEFILDDLNQGDKSVISNDNERNLDDPRDRTIFQIRDQINNASNDEKVLMKISFPPSLVKNILRMNIADLFIFEDMFINLKSKYKKLTTVEYDIIMYCFINGYETIRDNYFSYELPKDYHISHYIGKIYIVPSQNLKHGIPKIGKKYKFNTYKDGHYKLRNDSVIAKLRRYNFNKDGKYYLYHFYHGRKKKGNNNRRNFVFKFV